MYLNEQIQQKWAPVLDHEALPQIKDYYKRAITAMLLENQEQAIKEQQGMENGTLFEDTQTGSDVATAAGGTGGAGSGAAGFSGTATAPQAGYDPILISLVRRAMPNLISYDVCGVQAMSGPTGLIFAMRTQYVKGDGTRIASPEGLHDEAQTGHSAGLEGTTVEGVDNTTVHATDPFNSNYDGDTVNAVGTKTMEQASTFRQMSFSIDKVTVTAKSRALKAEYTTELAQDLKAIHGLDAETELSNILSTEILAEINREVVRTINTVAKPGAQHNTANTGRFDLDVDANGRWSVEKFKGLIFQIEREANEIGAVTRRGRGNILITSADVASALSMAGVLDYTPELNNSISSDVTGNTFAGTLNGRIKVYIDPYFAPASTGTSATHYFNVGYKGTSPYDAGIFYCPYVPLQMVRAVGENSFQPKIGFKTRYGLVANPFVESAAGVADGETLTANINQYYRLVQVENLM